ncbi:MAG: ATP-binding protein [Gammaproteobacteria bacterium]|nr:ATP-binding protein [Gammaproteobacteria bacterium]
MKTEIGQVDAIPSKRLFTSIIADYDLNRSICELIDNALDIWIKNGKSSSVEININLEKNQQTISVSDNAGGVKKSDLHLIVGPGQTSNLPDGETIGFFGVGTKRAVVALAQDIKITTRYGTDKTYQLEFDESWLKNEDWELPLYEIDDIAEGTTIVELQKLRFKLTDEALTHLKEHLQATYARFLHDNKVDINLDQEPLQPLNFENWAYPPDYPPHKYITNIKSEDGGTLKVEILAGLTRESSPAGGEYGVYFYCNDRLIARALKNYDVGFATGLAGLPHPSVSLVRVIVSLKGDAQLMPWNSSKSGINSNHNMFLALRTLLVQVVKDYASLSRTWSKKEGGWPENVFKYPSGDIKEIEIADISNAKKSYLLQLPKSKLRYADKVKQVNQTIGKEKPWTTGLYESIIAVDLIFNQKLEQKNRICLILLDSTLEIAFKEYLVNETESNYTDSKLLKIFERRHQVQNEIKNHITFSDSIWNQINYYYKFRNKLVHERATVGITDNQIKDYRGVVQNVLEQLFCLSFSE